MNFVYWAKNVQNVRCLCRTCSFDRGIFYLHTIWLLLCAVLDSVLVTGQLQSVRTSDDTGTNQQPIMPLSEIMTYLKVLNLAKIRKTGYNFPMYCIFAVKADGWIKEAISNATHCIFCTATMFT